MAHTASGFTGTVDQVAWAKMINLLTSSPFRVATAASWVPTVNSGVARTVTVSAGTGICCGVMDVTDIAYDVAFGANTGSSVRIDALVARFDWATTTVSFVPIAGTTVAPTILNTGTVADNARITQIPGVRFDAVIAYVPITVNAAVLPTSGTNALTDQRAIGADNGSPSDVPQALVRRDTLGNHRSNRVYADQAPATIDELTRKDYVDNVIAGLDAKTAAADQNLSTDITGRARWNTVVQTDTSYFWVPSTTGPGETMPGFDWTVNVPAGRVIEWEATIPILHSAGGFIHAAMLLNGVAGDGVVSAGDNNVWVSVKLSSLTTGGGLVRCIVQGWVQSGYGDIRASPAFGVRLRYRVW